AEFSGSFPKAAANPTTELTDTAARRFTASGDFDVRHGKFMQVPLLKNVLPDVKEASATTVGEIAATFEIADRKIKFIDAAASSPAVGVDGDGTLDFDGNVDLRFVISPLADWRRDVQATSVPVLSEIGG